MPFFCLFVCFHVAVTPCFLCSSLAAIFLEIVKDAKVAYCHGNDGKEKQEFSLTVSSSAGAAEG